MRIPSPLPLILIAEAMGGKLPLNVTFSLPIPLTPTYLELTFSSRKRVTAGIQRLEAVHPFPTRRGVIGDVHDEVVIARIILNERRVCTVHIGCPCASRIAKHAFHGGRVSVNRRAVLEVDTTIDAIAGVVGIHHS